MIVYLLHQQSKVVVSYKMFQHWLFHFFASLMMLSLHAPGFSWPSNAVFTSWRLHVSQLLIVYIKYQSAAYNTVVEAFCSWLAAAWLLKSWLKMARETSQTFTPWPPHTSWSLKCWQKHRSSFYLQTVSSREEKLFKFEKENAYSWPNSAMQRMC